MSVAPWRSVRAPAANAARAERAVRCTTRRRRFLTLYVALEFGISGQITAIKEQWFELRPLLYDAVWRPNAAMADRVIDRRVPRNQPMRPSWLRLTGRPPVQANCRCSSPTSHQLAAGARCRLPQRR